MHRQGLTLLRKDTYGRIRRGYNAERFHTYC
nr:MAG TPA: hypothetical protein [Caudoviricetes sp.]